MAKLLGCVLEVSEFELQSRYYVHFRIDTLDKGMNLLILPSMRYSVSLLFLRGWPCHYITQKSWYATKQRKQNQSWMPKSVFYISSFLVLGNNRMQIIITSSK